MRPVDTKSEVPPVPMPLKVLLGAGSAKSVCKILMSKNLEVKILRTKNLGRLRSRSAQALGLAHDRCFKLRAQGQMSQKVVDKPKTKSWQEQRPAVVWLRAKDKIPRPCPRKQRSGQGRSSPDNRVIALSHGPYLYLYLS